MPFMKNHYCKYKPNLRGAGKNIHHGEDEEQHPELETKRIACVVLLHPLPFSDIIPKNHGHFWNVKIETFFYLDGFLTLDL